MPKIARLTDCSDWIDLDSVERERTPSRLMKLGTRLSLAGLSLSNIVSELEKFGVYRSRKAVRDWTQKADPQPVDGKSPDRVAVDEIVIQFDDDQCWLYAAVDPETSHTLHIWLYPRRTTAVRETFLAELQQKHDVDESLFLADGAPWLQKACERHGLRFQHETYGNRNAVERVYLEVKRRIYPIPNNFGHVAPTTTE